MDWDKAKNLTIIFFLLLNTLLGVLLYRENNSYVMTAEQEKAIVSVLAQNRINLYTRIIREYKPMRSIELSECTYGEESFIKNFFNHVNELKLTEEHSRSIFEQGDARLSIQGDYVHYLNPQGIGKKEGVVQEPAAICEGWIKGLKMGDFELDGISQENDRYMLRYLNVYQGFAVQSNYIDLTVTDKGIVEIDLSYRAPQSYAGRSQMICSADEALFTFMQQMKNIYGNQDVFINKMDVVYHINTAAQLDGRGEAEPCYRIFVAGETLPFLINGYRNEML